MSTYSQYGIGSFEEAVEADLTYSGLAGAYRMVEENAINEHNIFEAVIGRDFMEAYAKQGAVTESALEAVNEASMTEIWGKVVDFIKKIGEKILGIIQNLKNKIQSVFIRDGKELVKKYDKVINEKMNKGHLAKMKFKYAKFDNSNKAFGGVFAELQATELGKTIETKLNTSKAGSIENSTTTDAGMDALRNMDEYKPLTQEKKDEYRDAFYAHFVSGADAKSFAKDFDKAAFADAEEKEGFDSAIRTTCEDFLKNGGDSIKDLETDEKNCKKWIKERMDEAKKIQTEMNKAISNTKNAASAYKANGLAGQVISLCNVASAGTTAVIGAVGTAYKKQMKQCRSIYIKAATYGGKTEATDIEFLTAVEEASNYEVDLMFED